ncbi:hypothetical protein ACFFGV_14535 [Pontibacillus salicampi]|uniref:Uncharacterized protein n=1 Tax=Pontibacillus salicampi TaxID=1449801 RepID=A0ABV6LR68_9BACI
MKFGKGQSQNYPHMYSLCNKHMKQYVLAELADGQYVDGIITGLDGEYVYIAVPQNVEGTSSMAAPPHHQVKANISLRQPYQRQGNQAAYNTYQPPKRFQRYILPLGALLGINPLPWY